MSAAPSPTAARLALQHASELKENVAKVKEGEEKWQTFARVIRDIMAEVGNLEKSDLSIEDKFEYKRQVYSSSKDKKMTD